MFSLLADKLAASRSLLFVELSVLVESTIFLLGNIGTFYLDYGSMVCFFGLAMGFMRIQKIG
jgi:hypothetical protein